MEEEENPLAFEAQLKKSRFLNDRAAAEQSSKSHRPHGAQISEYDRPLGYRKRKSGPSSNDHLLDPDVARYQAEIRRIRISNDIKGNEAARIAERLNKRAERSRLRNVRAADYDISGRTRVDFVNDNNRRFTKKLARAFGEHTEDIRQNIEHGTAV